MRVKLRWLHPLTEGFSPQKALRKRCSLRRSFGLSLSSPAGGGDGATTRQRWCPRHQRDADADVGGAASNPLPLAQPQRWVSLFITFVPDSVESRRGTPAGRSMPTIGAIHSRHMEPTSLFRCRCPPTKSNCESLCLILCVSPAGYFKCFLLLSLCVLCVFYHTHTHTHTRKKENNKTFV